MARLEGGGDDDVAPRRLVRAQEDASRVDVDGAGGPVLQAVHAVLTVLLHLRQGDWSQSPSATPPAPRLSLPPVEVVESTHTKCPEEADPQRQK